jgi:hypothetical protein
VTFTSEFNQFLRRSIGLEIHKPHSIFDNARMHVIDSEKIALLLDVGANEGEWATRIHRDGYFGRILSLEPSGKAVSNHKLNPKEIFCGNIERRANYFASGSVPSLHFLSS